MTGVGMLVGTSHAQDFPADGVIETLIGLEITDESDTVENMRALARKRWRERMRTFGVNPDNLE